MKQLASLLTALVFVGGTACAQIITQTLTFSGLSDPDNQVFSFETFNSSLGTLNSVDIDLSNVVVSGTATVTNQSSSASSYVIQLQGNYIVSDQVQTGTNVTDGTPVGTNVQVNIDTPNYVSDSVAADGGTLTTGTISNSASPGSGSTAITGSDLLGYESGDGTISLYLNSSNSVSARGSAPYEVDESSVGSGTIQVIYNYTPIPPVDTPEPSTTAMMILGTGLLAFWGFRRRAQQA